MQINALPFLSHKSDITNINFEINHKRKNILTVSSMKRCIHNKIYSIEQQKMCVDGEIGFYINLYP